VMNTHPLVSVIIPTYQSWSTLRFCLSALLEQDYPADRIQIIVINNDPISVVPEDLMQFGIEFLIESKTGSYAARNLGVRHAIGEILAFTDADCVPAKTWISATVDFFSKVDCDCIAGRISVIPNKSPKDAIDCHQVACEFDQLRWSKKGLSVTANLIVKKSFFNRVGLFDENLLSGGDWDWCRRARKLNIRMCYNPKAVVFHPARLGWGALLKKSRRIKSVLHFADAKPFDFFKIFMSFLTIALPPINKFYIIFNSSELTFREKLMAFSVAYVLRIYGKVVLLLSFFGLIKSTRS